MHAHLMWMQMLVFLLPLVCSGFASANARVDSPAVQAQESITYVTVGHTPNQLHIVDGQILSINSGFQTVPSLSLVNGQLQVKNLPLPEGTNPYRGARDGDDFWLSYNMTDELVRLSVGDILVNKSVQPKVMYQPPESTTGAETVLVDDAHIWVAYSNMRTDWDFGPGEILLFNKTKAELGPVMTLQFAERNPKYLLAIGNQRVAVVFGEYGKNNGQIAIIDKSKLDFHQTKTSFTSDAAHPAIRYIKTGGVPGTLNAFQNQLWSCNLLSPDQTGTVYVTDLVTNQVKAFTTQLPSCAQVLPNENYVYALNLDGGSQGRSKEHLFVYARQSFAAKCQLELLPPKAPSPTAVFPTDMLTYSTKDHTYLVVALSGARRLAFIELDPSGLPRACKSDQRN